MSTQHQCGTCGHVVHFGRCPSREDAMGGNGGCFCWEPSGDLGGSMSATVVLDESEWESSLETRARAHGGRWVVEQRDVLRGPWREVTT